MDSSIGIPTELAAFIPVITGLMQVIKAIPQVAKISQWLPLIAIALGLVVGYIAMPAETETVTRLVNGLVLGIASSGLYSGVKALGQVGASS